MTNTRATPSPHLDSALLVLRVVIGTIFAVHGWQKVFSYGIAGVTAGFTKMGVPVPGFTAPAIGILELVGGAALILGLLGRPVAALLAMDMIGAIVFVHFKNGFFMPTGYEFVLTLAGASAALALAGPGRFAADAMFAGRRFG